MSQIQIEMPRQAIEDFCRKWKILRLEIFGSVLREDFHTDSDIDFLVTFSPESKWSLMDMVVMEQEMKCLLGREVDIVERKAVESSHNWIRRKEILGSAREYYAA